MPRSHPDLISALQLSTTIIVIPSSKPSHGITLYQVLKAYLEEYLAKNYRSHRLSLFIFIDLRGVKSASNVGGEQLLSLSF